MQMIFRLEARIRSRRGRVKGTSRYQYLLILSNTKIRPRGGAYQHACLHPPSARCAYGSRVLVRRISDELMLSLLDIARKVCGLYDPLYTFFLIVEFHLP